MPHQQFFQGFGLSLDEKIELAINTLKEYEKFALKNHPDGYYGCFSGGKDSVVVKEIARLAQVEAVWYYNVTTIDPPEIHRFIRYSHPDVKWDRPSEHFFKVFLRRGYPTRVGRWCCQVFKERGGTGRIKIVGIRSAESPRRAARWKIFTRWEPKTKKGDPSYLVSPILLWSDIDVWRFIREKNLPYCRLYDEGFKRLGCVGCPMASKEEVERGFTKWPAYRQAWRKAFHRLWRQNQGRVMSRGKRKGKPWPGWECKSADELFDWWRSNASCPDKGDSSCQMGLF